MQPMFLGAPSPLERLSRTGLNAVRRLGWRRQRQRAVLVRCTERFAVGAAHRTDNGFVIFAQLVRRGFPPMSVWTGKGLGHALSPRLIDQLVGPVARILELTLPDQLVPDGLRKLV